MSCCVDPVVKSDLLLALVLIENVLKKLVFVTSGHLSGSRFRWHQPGFFGIPRTPSVGGAATNVQVFRDPDLPTTVLIVHQIVARTLRSEPFTQPVKQRCQVLLGKLFVLFPGGYNRRLEFLFVEFRWVGVVGLE